MADRSFNRNSIASVWLLLIKLYLSISSVY
jgi:hypothetical protein